MYDTVNGNTPSYLSDLFSNVCKSNFYNSTLRNTEYNVVLDHVPKTEYYKGSFSYRGGMHSLPNDIKAAESKAVFKMKLASRQANCMLATFYYILFFVHIFSVVMSYLPCSLAHGTKSAILDGKKMQQPPKQSDFHRPRVTFLCSGCPTA